jgi:hypothetical protein
MTFKGQDEFVRLYERGELTPLTEVAAIPTDTSVMQQIDWALTAHHGLLIRYLKWQTEFFALAKDFNVTPLQLAELAHFKMCTMTAYKEEEKFIVSFLRQNGKPI